MFEFHLEGTTGPARAGTLTLPHGQVRTPAFMPVGTHAVVRGLSASDVRRTGAQIILGNTYHLHLRPGENVVQSMGGLHRFTTWDRPMLTDSGGFQVFSLEGLRRIEEHGVEYEVSEHERVVSAQRLAAVEHVSGWEVAKPVVLSVDGELAMVVVPGAVSVDLAKARAALGGEEVRLAAEEEFLGVFDDSEDGAEPPFGNLYGMRVYLDERLAEQERIVTRDGSHTRTLSLATADFVRLVEPEIVDVARA
jgi:queuine/archaeosine tRNA-ribosyltransferase